MRSLSPTLLQSPPEKPIKTHLDRRLVPPEPLADLLRDAGEELEREIRVGLEVLSVLLRVPEAFDDARRDYCVVDGLLRLELQVPCMLHVGSQDGDRAGEDLIKRDRHKRWF